MSLDLNKYEDLGELEYAQVDQNWKDIEEAAERATVAELYSQDNDKIISPDMIKSALAWAEYSTSGTFSWSFNGRVNNKIVVSGNSTFKVNSPETPGKSCTIKVLGNNATERTVTLGSGFKGPQKVFTGITNTKGILLSILVDDATSVFASALEFEE